MTERIVNSSAYGFCVFQAEALPELRKRLLDHAHQIETDSPVEQIRGTILLSEEGVNIRLSGTLSTVNRMKEALRGLHTDLQAMEFKDSYSERLTLPRLLVKLKKEVISMGCPDVQPATEGLAAHISAEEFKQWLDEDRDMLVLDTRNDYEVRLGTFEKAVDLDIKSFRAFPERVQEHLKDVPKEKPVVMFCTGGVRCEKASYVLLKDGYKQVYQLDGGILKYFERVGGAHYRGDCYIFDDRVALKPDLTEGSAIACFTCRSPLTESDQQSQDFVQGEHCPYCKNGKLDFRAADGK
ncbi:hypothetical protein Poli38472_004091 [Pythium oligandrum]|uniref:Rhodanese domain-containing protein n=1 Tax=Pythium oligandrum TaxID=41045 RepID=A0A8K1CPF2_PYTOL|nr:hypothetical protein Poli38472_004091 [Pythium oligandrum]|eukprot:TMW66326.1 hypothetical protein Poli38472_004091 [Pythium oligandrum]